MTRYLFSFPETCVNEDPRDGSGSFDVAAVSENGAC